MAVVCATMTGEGGHFAIHLPTTSEYFPQTGATALGTQCLYLAWLLLSGKSGQRQTGQTLAYSVCSALGSVTSPVKKELYKVYIL